MKVFINKNKARLSLILNCLTVAAVTAGVILVFVNPNAAAGGLSSETPLSAFRFFTTDSNVLAGIIAALFIVYQVLSFKGKIDEIPTFVYVLKLVGTVGVAVTLLTVVFYLAPFAPSGFLSMFTGRDLFFHLIVPVLSLAAFVFTENTEKIKFRYTLFGIVPILSYGVIYAINAFSHAVDGVVPYEYDWYGFAQGGVAFAIVAFAIILAMGYIVSVLLWLGNKKLARKR